MSTDIEIAILLDPTSSSGGKYYIAALDSRVHFAVFGGNTANNSGQITDKTNLSSMDKVVREKRAKGYGNVGSTSVPKPALTAFVNEVIKRLQLPAGSAWNVVGTKLVFSNAGARTAPQGARRPRISARDNVAIWI